MSESEDQDLERLKVACGDLAEHFDSVQIFVTRLQDKEDGDEGTVNASWGTGNWFTRKGQITEWVLKAEERSRREVREEEA